MKEFEFLSVVETEELIVEAQKGSEEAKSKLLDGNYPLIKSIVKKKKKKGFEYEDLYQLGCVGFLKAISNFDSKFGVKFSTYAVPMIAGEIKRFLRDDGIIKISRHYKEIDAHSGPQQPSKLSVHTQSPPQAILIHTIPAIISNSLPRSFPSDLQEDLQVRRLHRS